MSQAVDSVQVIARGALQGLKDTRGPMIIALVCHWGVGLPLAGYLGVVLGWGGEAIWGSLTFALTIAGVLLLFRFRKMAKKLNNDLNIQE